MTTELRLRNQSQQLYIRALSQAWRNGVQVYDPSLWLLREPELEEKMLRDADIAHALNFRRQLIAGRDWNLLPRVEKSPRAQLAVSVGTELLKSISHFTGARFNLSRAFFSGARFARIHGKTRVLRLGDGRERVWWVPSRLEDVDKRRFRIAPINDGHTLQAKWQRWNVVTENWDDLSVEEAIQTVKHVYQDDEGTLGYGRGLREALGWWWYAKTHVFEESLQAVERFAQGILTAKVDGIRDGASGKPNTDLVTAWQEVLQDVRSRHVLVYDAADQVEVVHPSGEGWQMFSDLRKELRSTITTLVLGSTLPTTADEGGSYALGGVQENSTEALIQFDREALQETLTDDVVGCCWYKNHANLVELGIAEEKPRFNLKQEKRQDPKERAEVAERLHNMGVDLSREDVLDQCGFRIPEDGEDIIEGREAGAAMDPFGVAPFGGSGDEEPFPGPGLGGRDARGVPSPGLGGRLQTTGRDR